MASLNRRLARWAAERPDATAFTFLRRGEQPHTTLSFAALERRAGEIGAQLAREGLAGRPVALIYPPGLEFIEAFCGCLHAGAIAAALPLPANARAAARAAAICRTAGVAAVLTLGEQAGADALAPIRAAAPTAVWICTDQAVGGGMEPVETPDDAPAFLQFTSGSTREPKGVAITHANLAANQEMIAEAFGHDADTRFVTWLPLHHDMGLVGTVLQPIHLGATSVVMSPHSFLQKPARWLRAIADHGATTSGAPNFAYAMCLERIAAGDCEGLDLSSWRTAFCGSEPVRPATLSRFAERFAAFGFDPAALFPCYGMAEATLFVSGGPAGSGLRTAEAGDGRRVASCGPGWGAQSLAIADPVRGIARAAGERGEIWLSGPHIAAGYWNDEAATALSFGARLAGHEEHYLRTGDIGFVQDGELFVTGRLKDLLIVRGANIHPEDVEETVRASDPALAGAACAAFATGEDDEEIVVLVEHGSARAGADPDLSAVRAAVVQAHGFVPERIALVRPGALPRTTSGKVRRQACREGWLEGRFEARALETEA